MSIGSLYFVTSDGYCELYFRIQKYKTTVSVHSDVPILFLNVALKLPYSQFLGISDKSAYVEQFLLQKYILVSF